MLKTDENINQVKEKLINKCKVTITELVEHLNIAYGPFKIIVVNIWN